MNCGIYKIPNKIDGKMYVGSSKNLKRRGNNHLKSLENNEHHNIFLQRAYNKYGKENFSFEVILICEEKDLITYEDSIIKLYQTNDKAFGYNLRKVAESNRGMEFDKGIYKPGEKYNKLTLIQREKTKNLTTMWLCSCDCGNKIVTSAADVKTGHTKSCGCHNIQQLIHSHTIHGRKWTREYAMWCKMKEKCYSVNNLLFKTHGALGIRVSDEWQEFHNFFHDMGVAPSGMGICRKDIKGEFSKGNCFWADRKTINRNCLKNVFINVNDKLITIVEASEFLGINRSSIRQRSLKYDETYQQAADHFYKKMKDRK